MRRLALLPLCAAALVLLAGFWHGGGQQYYFSSSTGSDSNNCMTTLTPCQTVTKANSLTYPDGSVLNFLQGDTFTLSSVPLRLLGNNNGIGTQNALGAVTVQSYGGGTCNVIAGTFTGCATFQVSSTNTIAILGGSINNFTVKNVRVLGGTSAVLAFQAGFGVYYSMPGTSTGIGVTIQNVEAKDFATGIYINAPTGTGSSLSGVSILNNYAHCSAVTTTCDSGIWVRFLVTSGTVQGNLVENIGGHASGAYGGGSGNGILLADGASGILDQFNVTRANGANTTTCGGPAGNWAYDSHNITFQFNESYDNKPVPFVSGCDWDGFDLDAGVFDSVLQYNYSHGNYGAGYLAFMNPGPHGSWANNLIRYNISEKDTPTLNFGAVTFTGSSGPESAVYNNTLYTHSTNVGSYNGGGQCLMIFNTTSTLFINNICINDSSNAFIYASGTNATIDYNDYFYIGTPSSFFAVFGPVYGSFAAYQAGTGNDAHGKNVDPSLTSSGAGGTCYSSGQPAGPQSCPSAYKLLHGSAMVGAGVNPASAPFSLSGVGARDYYGTAIPHGVGSGHNIGADGGNP